MAESAAASTLNDRQRAYVLATSSVDQGEEDYERTAWSRARRRPGTGAQRAEVLGLIRAWRNPSCPAEWHQ